MTYNIWTICYFLKWMISDLRGICLNLERDLPEESGLGGAQFPRDRHTGNILSWTSRGGGGGRVLVVCWLGRKHNKSRLGLGLAS